MIRTLLASILLLILASCASTPASPGELPGKSPPAAVLDTSMVPLCERVLAGDASVEGELAASPVVGMMAEGQREQVGYTPAEFAAAAVGEKEDPRFSWGRLRKNGEYLRTFVAGLRARSTELVAAALDTATEFLPEKLDPAGVRIHLVCGSPWDAFVLEFARTEVFFDLGFYADGPPDQAISEFEAIMVHELWHLALLEHQKRHWGRDYRHGGTPQARFLYRMLNEGVGHYYSMLPRLEPRPKWPDLAERERRAFAMLAEGYPKYLAETDPARKEKILWSSHAGVPFWDKWSAIPGALMIHHLKDRLGAKGIETLLIREPFSPFIEYDRLCKENPGWPKLPGRLVEDAKAELASLGRPRPSAP